MIEIDSIEVDKKLHIPDEVIGENQEVSNVKRHIACISITLTEKASVVEKDHYGY